MIDWNKQFIVPVRESQEAQAKHLVIKSLIQLLIKVKYAHTLRHQKVYSEFNLGECIPDVFHENFKTKEIICYEVQNNVNQKYIEKKNEFYNNYHQLGFKITWQLIKLEEAPDSIEDLINWLKQRII